MTIWVHSNSLGYPLDFPKTDLMRRVVCPMQRQTMGDIHVHRHCKMV